jgi:AHBA synthesis associated protein
MKISAVIFDLDGTLIDSMDVMQHAYVTAYHEVVGEGEPPPFSEYCRHLGRSFPEIMRRMGLPVAMHPVFVRESVRNMHKIRLYPGVVTLLEELSGSGVPLAIATGKDHARSSNIAAHLQIEKYFRMILGSDQVACPKPAPEMALRIAAELQLNPAHTLLVGDAMADILCGRSAGMYTALATWSGGCADVQRQAADFQLDRPDQILPLLRVEYADTVAGEWPQSFEAGR